MRTKGAIQVPRENLPRVGLVNFGVNSRSDEIDWLDSCRSRHLEPEQELLKAILIDAYYVAISPVTHTAKGTHETYQHKKKTQDEARRWIKSDDDSWIFSFFHVCEGLNLSPGYVRKRIQKMYRKAG